jgi:uncharacterized protein YcnI
VRAVGAAVALGALVLVPAAAASAHVRVVPEATTAGGWTVLTFRVPNESASASTTRVTVDLPTGTPLTSVSTRPVPGWTAVVEEGELPEPVDVDGATITRAPLHVTWTADGAGIADGQFEEFALSVGPLPEAGTPVVLPAHQEYSDGEVVDWDEVADGGTEPEHPAPELTTTAAGTGTGTGADEGTAGHGHGADDGGADAAAAPGATSSADPVSRVLGGLGLAAGVVALVVALLGRRQSSTGRSTR